MAEASRPAPLHSAFVGRTGPIAVASELFTEDSNVHVLYVHGPGGMGKTALLREVGRVGADHGWTARWVNGRELSPVPEDLERAFDVRDLGPRPLVVFDGFDHVRQLGAHLRRTVLPNLPERAAVVLADRGTPDPAWYTGIWGQAFTSLELEALSEDESLALLEAWGVLDKERARTIAVWAGGSPLALKLAADVPEREQSLPSSPTTGIARRIVGDEAHGRRRDILDVAAIARVTTIPMLERVLPDIDAEEAHDWLSSRSFAEPAASGVMLHEMVRAALLAELRRTRSDAEREWRRRIADHLHDRALHGEPRFTIELAGLVESRVRRSGHSWARGVHVDIVRAGDLEAIEAVCDTMSEASRRTTRRFFDENPEHVAIARDDVDEVVGYAIAVTPTAAPHYANEDQLLGRWLGHAREASMDGNAIIWRDTVDLRRSQSPGSEVIAMLNTVSVLRSGLINPRFGYLPVDPRQAGHVAFPAGAEARRVPELDVRDGTVMVRCWLLDYGPGGLLGAQRDTVYQELGLAPPSSPSDDPRAELTVELVRDLLRSFGDDDALAASALAIGPDVSSRAAHVRHRIRDAATLAFGTAQRDQTLALVLERGYLDKVASHEEIADGLGMPRQTYFRALRTAAERLTALLQQQSES